MPRQSVPLALNFCLVTARIKLDVGGKKCLVYSNDYYMILTLLLPSDQELTERAVDAASASLARSRAPISYGDKWK